MVREWAWLPVLTTSGQRIWCDWYWTVHSSRLVTSILGTPIYATECTIYSQSEWLAHKLKGNHEQLSGTDT